MSALLTVDEALALIEAQARPLPPREMALRDALGLQLAADVRSDVDSPPHDKTIMDGYAVVSGDLSPERRVLEEVIAGAVPTQTVVPGAATRVMTGAPIPAGADAIIPVEQSTLLESNMVRFTGSDVKAGQFIMRRGDSVRAGQVVVEQGATLRSLEIGVCAEAGCARVNVVPRSRVAVLPTGNELVAIDTKPGAGMIRNSNGPMLAAAVREAGCEAEEMEVSRDDRTSMTAAISAALAADVVLLSGGVSAGTMDLVPSVLESLGVEQVLHKVAIKPGKPIWFGVKLHDKGRRTLVFGLPGNPLSSFVCYQVFVRPALAALAGHGFTGLAKSTVQMTCDFDYRGGGRETFWPVRLTTEGALPLAWRGSSDLAAWAVADALLRLPVAPVHLQAGKKVEILRLDNISPQKG